MPSQRYLNPPLSPGWKRLEQQSESGARHGAQPGAEARSAPLQGPPATPGERRQQQRRHSAVLIDHPAKAAARRMSAALLRAETWSRGGRGPRKTATFEAEAALRAQSRILKRRTGLALRHSGVAHTAQANTSSVSIRRTMHHASHVGVLYLLFAHTQFSPLFDVNRFYPKTPLS